MNGGLTASDCVDSLRDSIDPARLDAIGPRFEGWRDANVHAVVVARFGKTVYERYFSGEDERWGETLGRVSYDASTRHDMRSITKSIVSLLTGVALDKGWIASIDEPVLSFFPEYAELAVSAVREVTLRHLLSMSAGFEWNEALPYSDPANSERRMTDEVDRCRYVLERPVVCPPGAKYQYNGGLTMLLAEVITRASGRAIDVVARDMLFEPLGIADVEWVRYADGTPVASSGLRMRAADLVKIGQLVLNGGAWADRQIVPATWIADSTAAQIGADGLYFYGFQWWLGRSLVKREAVSWIAGIGYGGQRLYVVPSLGIVVVVLAGLYARPDLSAVVGDTILNELLLAVPHYHSLMLNEDAD